MVVSMILCRFFKNMLLKSINFLDVIVPLFPVGEFCYIMKYVLISLLLLSGIFVQPHDHLDSLEAAKDIAILTDKVFLLVANIFTSLTCTILEFSP